VIRGDNRQRCLLNDVALTLIIAATFAIERVAPPVFTGIRIDALDTGLHNCQEASEAWKLVDIDDATECRDAAACCIYYGVVLRVHDPE
jgi:hypothetical protein